MTSRIDRPHFFSAGAYGSMIDAHIAKLQSKHGPDAAWTTNFYGSRADDVMESNDSEQNARNGVARVSGGNSVDTKRDHSFWIKRIGGITVFGIAGYLLHAVGWRK